MFKRLSALVACLLAVQATLAPPARIQRAPNIVVILIDALRRDHLPFYGYPKDTAPFLSRLAARGVVFEHAYSTSAWTPPSVASLFTSLYPVQHGVTRGPALAERIERLTGTPVRLNRLPRAAETIPEALARRGYRTFAVTENPNLSEQMGYDQGFSGFSNFPKSLVAEKITATLSEQRAQILGRQPYFLYVHYMDVHGPYRERPPFFDPTSEGDARQISAYDSGIFTVDDHIRRAWQAFGWDDALVVVLADHGEALGDRGQWGHGISLFAELLNIPMLVSLPGHNSARRLGDPVSLVDILPTLREVAGLPPAPTDEGVSLWPLLMGRANSLAPRPLYAHVWRGRAKGGRDHVLRGTLLRGWKRIGGGPEGALLFDLARDPMDQHNRAHDFPEIAAELQRRHLAFEAGCRKLAPEVNDVELDSEAVENLKALGYVQ